MSRPARTAGTIPATIPLGRLGRRPCRGVGSSMCRRVHHVLFPGSNEPAAAVPPGFHGRWGSGRLTADSVVAGRSSAPARAVLGRCHSASFQRVLADFGRRGDSSLFLSAHTDARILAPWIVASAISGHSRSTMPRPCDCPGQRSVRPYRAVLPRAAKPMAASRGRVCHGLVTDRGTFAGDCLKKPGRRPRSPQPSRVHDWSRPPGAARTFDDHDRAHADLQRLNSAPAQLAPPRQRHQPAPETNRNPEAREQDEVLGNATGYRTRSCVTAGAVS